MIRTASFLLIFFVALSCKNKVHKEFYPSGNLKFESEVGENGLFNGGYIEYYDSGEIKAKGKYVDGSISDTVYLFYRNGKLKAKGLFQNKIKKGWWNYYRQDGEPKSLEEYLVIHDSMYKNQSIHYLNNGEIDLKNSSFFSLEVPDTMVVGKNVGKVLNYNSNYSSDEYYLSDYHFLTVIVENEYENGLIKKDTFSDGTFTPSFGVFARKKGNQTVRGRIMEEIVYDIPSDSSVVVKEHFKYFEKDVFVQ
ncbi:Antitoxin component YwqK of the YwqJK toxin-antitoxin module [Zobellia uliginosa]|uniref:Antitoxin component YwqK of the YwqJK toxin-antitoxin module n=1 Tax=Zobellia uliginosa TaxID=143224 RepID=A0ABY1L0H6_9FLAO|nr:hypothetical protein [Zobellia uliginosa]SIT01926.1 Antitoxin component YwqK of the YwqJK toxin-antitoxin module [Zobellia uliginosa]